MKYLNAEGRNTFERPYGLAWLLQLSAELKEWNDPDARQWSKALEPLEQQILLAGHSKFDWIFAEERNQSLRLQRAHQGVAPREHGAVRHIDQAHGSARVKLACRAQAAPAAIGEGALLAVAGGAGLCLVESQALVVEEITAQFHLFLGHGIIGRYVRKRKARRQVPIVRPQLFLLQSSLM